MTEKTSPKNMRRFIAPLFLCVCSLLSGPARAQNAVRIEPAVVGRFGRLTRPYQQRNVPQINLSNSSRLESLIRPGNLYPSAPDAVALAIENNIDAELHPYHPL